MYPDRSRLGGRLSLVVTAALLAFGTACASTGATFRSGVGDAFLTEPPYYAGTGARDTGKVGHLPVTYQRGGSQSAMFDPTNAPNSAVASLLADLTSRLDSLGATVRLAPVAQTSAAVAPDVFFGCEVDATGDCERTDDRGALGRGRTTTMRLAVGRPSAQWVDALHRSLDEARASTALVITLEVGQYWTRQSGLRGDKSVLLGTRHTASLPWLTSVETPVTVLQLTGALVDRDGRAVRIGAEGLLAKRTGLVMSGLGAQAVLSEDDVAQLRALRREDLPNKPLVWEVALRQLVASLTGRTEVALR